MRNTKDNSNNEGFVLPILILVILILTASFTYSYYQNKGNNKSYDDLMKTTGKLIEINENQFNNWTTYTDVSKAYSFKCPSNWTYDNKQVDYNSKVKINKCILENEVSKYEFIDGIIVKIGFIPDEVAASEEMYAKNIGEVIQNQDNYQTYTMNGFDVWMSLANDSHTLKMVARKTVNGGFYEIAADAAGNMVSDEQYKSDLDMMMNSFKIN